MAIDRLVVRAMLACLLAAALMLGNRWIVAHQQADALAALLLDNARAAALHALGRADPELVASEVLAMSPHHLAAALLVADTALASRARGDLPAGVGQALTAKAGSLDGVRFDADGRLVQVAPWGLLPARAVVEVRPAGQDQALRVWVSLDLAQASQWQIFTQGVKSVVIALAAVLGIVLLILRGPRRSLAEAGRFAASLSERWREPLPRIESGLSAIDGLRDSLNRLNELLEAQRRRQQVDALQLQAAARQAEADAQAKSDFLAQMTHELRTPLNGVLGLTRLLLDTPLSALQRHHLSTAHASAGQLLQVVNDVLDQSRIDAGKLRIEAVPFSLYAVLDEACKPFALRAAHKSIELINEVCPNLPLTVIGDPMRLRQVLVNLIGNAVKFTDQGHVRLHVEGLAPSASLDDARRAVIAFHVSDTGHGIADSAKAVIFEPFSQADVSTARRYGGSGLGLSISKRLLGLMGSELKVETTLGRGSMFSFEIDFALPARPADGHLAFCESQPGQRVLWVDPSGQSVPWYRTVFGLWSIELQHAGSLAQAVQALRQRPYLALFFDHAACSAADEQDLHALLAQRAQVQRLCLMLCADETLHPMLEQQADDMSLIVKPVSPLDLNRALAGQSSRPAAPTARLDGLRLLVVDDNDVNQLVATALLESLGAEVKLAFSGEHALQRLAIEPFDLVLMDLDMPGLGGLEATRRLRAAEQLGGRGRLPVLALTASCKLEEAERIRGAGMDGHVGKPIQMPQLLAELDAVLAGRRRGPGQTVPTVAETTL